MRSIKRIQSLIGVVGLLRIGGPITVGVVTGASEIETNSGRALPRPAASFSYPQELSAWLGEHATMKSLAIRLDGWIDRSVFSEVPVAGSASPRVTNGLNGVMYIADAFNEACSPHIATEELVSRLSALTSLIEQSGREVRLLISPDKSTILPEFLPSAFALQECFSAYNTDFWEQLRNAGIPGFLDLRTALEDARLTRRELLFKRRDTHWDDAGAAVASRALISSLSPKIWNDDELIFNGTTEYFGDLNVLSGESLIDVAPSYSLVRDGITQENVLLIDDLEHARNRRMIFSGSQSQLIAGRTLVLGDSFSEAAEGFFLQFFSDITLMRLVDYSPDRYVDLIAESDRVIIWSVERTTPYRVAFDWGTPEFLDLLDERLKVGE